MCGLLLPRPPNGHCSQSLRCLRPSRALLMAMCSLLLCCPRPVSGFRRPPNGHARSVALLSAPCLPLIHALRVTMCHPSLRCPRPVRALRMAMGDLWLRCPRPDRASFPYLGLALAELLVGCAVAPKTFQKTFQDQAQTILSAKSAFCFSMLFAIVDRRLWIWAVETYWAKVHFQEKSVEICFKSLIKTIEVRIV